MKGILNACLLLTSLIGYLEWGGGNHAFLGQAEYDIFFNSSNKLDAFMHPFVLVPLLGQLALLITVFQKQPNRVLTIIGLLCLSLIMVFLFAIGLFGSLRMALAASPFIITAILVMRGLRRKAKNDVSLQ